MRRAISNRQGHIDICMFGMSDDERSDPSEEDADEQEIDSHVVAATLQESGAGAFIAACPLQPEQLGFAVGLSLEGRSRGLCNPP